MKGRERAGLILRKERGRPVPASAFDSEAWDRAPEGAEFDLRERSNRSSPHHRLYWQALTFVVEAVGRSPWPTAEHLHDAMKRELGYVTISYGMDGTPYVTTDSTAFDAMRQSDFRTYFDLAMQTLAERLGFDPLGFMSEAA